MPWRSQLRSCGLWVAAILIALSGAPWPLPRDGCGCGHRVCAHSQSCPLPPKAVRRPPPAASAEPAPCHGHGGAGEAPAPESRPSCAMRSSCGHSHTAVGQSSERSILTPLTTLAGLPRLPYSPADRPPLPRSWRREPPLRPPRCLLLA